MTSLVRTNEHHQASIFALVYNRESVYGLMSSSPPQLGVTSLHPPMLTSCTLHHCLRVFVRRLSTSTVMMSRLESIAGCGPMWPSVVTTSLPGLSRNILIYGLEHDKLSTITTDSTLSHVRTQYQLRLTPTTSNSSLSSSITLNLYHHQPKTTITLPFPS